MQKVQPFPCFYCAILSGCFQKNSTHHIIMKISNKWELQQTVFNHSSDIDFKDFMNLYKKCIERPYSFLVINASLAPDNPSLFRKNLLEIT